MEHKKPILIQGAMQVEIAYLLEQLEEKKEQIIQGYPFWKGNIQGYPVVISKTEIGSVNATMATTIGMMEFQPSIVLNQGVAGACTRNIHKKEVVIGVECKNTNSYKTPEKKQGEGSNPLEWNLLTFTSDDELETEKKLLADENLVQLAREINYPKGNIHFGILGSGDCWNNEIDRIDWINKQTNISCSDMESIGAYSVANRFQVPVMGIRVMSDNALLQEEYEREVSLEAQKITLAIVKKYIEKQLKGKK